jgi:hypothetical protein
VSITASLSISLICSVLMFISVGLLCGLSFLPWTGSATLLDQVYALGTPLARVTFYAFPIIANLTSIPVNSIFQRLNLLSQGVNPHVSTLLAVLLPWLIAIPLYSGDGYIELCQWSGVVVTSVVNFIVPPALYCIAVRRTTRHENESQEKGEVGGEDGVEGEEWQAQGEMEGQEGEEGQGGSIEVSEEEEGEADLHNEEEEKSEDEGKVGTVAVWHVLPFQWRRYQLLLGVVVLMVMIVLCALTLALNVEEV